MPRISLAFLLLAACSNPDANILKSSQQRLTSPNAPASDVSAVTAGNTALALAELQRQPTSQNVIFSPYSASLALAMTYQGANGATQTQMATALHFPFGPDRLGQAFDALDLAVTGDARNDVALQVANAAWVQQGFAVQHPYLDALAQDYGAGVGVTPFATDPEKARQEINSWASGHTDGKIPELFAPGSIDKDARLVLGNAVYFKASWQTQFDPHATQAAPFARLDGTQASVPMMNLTTKLGYSSGTGYQAVELPYVHQALSMVVVLPDAGTFSQFEANLSPAQLGSIVSGLSPVLVQVSLPKFTARTSLDLSADLKALGMVDAFGSAADFSGIDGARDLFITKVVQKAYVDVDESGTEAAAATGVSVGVMSIEEPAAKVIANRPFLYFIRDIQTGAVLFMGSVADPSIVPP